MSKDFRAKQVRTNKIIGRSDNAVGGSGSKIQLALMKSGSADFAGGLKSPANPTVGGDDVGRVDREKGNIGTDVWMLVDGASSNRYSRSSGESVLFLGDVVVSGTLYAERQRISITTTSLIENEDHSLLLSGSVYVNEDQGISVGKTAIISGNPGNTLTDPRASLSLGAKDSVFWSGNNPGSGAPASRENPDQANTPDPLLVILPDAHDNDAGDNLRGRIGIGTHQPGAKLEIMAASGPAGGAAELPHLKFRNSTNSDDDNATFTLLDNGTLKIATNDATAQSGDLVFDVDGATDLNSYGNITIDSSNGTISVGADNVNQNINIGTDGQREVTIGDASANNSAGLTLRANTGGIDIDCQRTTGDLQLDTAGGAIHIGHNAAAGNISIGTNATARTITIGNETGATAIDIDAGTGGVAIDSQGAGSIGIGTQTDTGAINIGTGASARTITVGNVTTTTGLVLNSGEGGVTINSTGIGDIVINSDDVMTLDSDGVLEINSSAGAISIGNDDVSQAINVGTGAAARTITIGNATGATEIDVNTGTGGFKVDTQSGGGISLDAVAAASNLTVSTGGENEKDLTISVAGGGNSSLFITSDGTGADSLEIDTTVGSMTIGKSLADGQTLKIGKNSAVEMIFSPHGTAASEKWSLINTSGDAADALKLQAAAGGIDIDAATTLDIDTAGLITVDSSAGAIEVTASGAEGHINVVTGHTAGTAFHLDANAHAGSIVDIDAGILDIDATGQINIDAGGQLFLEGTGDSRLRTVTSGNLNVESAAILNHTGATGVNITATSNSVAITGNTEVDLTAAFVDINAGATGLDVDAGAGGIAVDTTGTLSIDSADTTNLTMTANSGPAKTLTIDAINSGAGTASITVGATSGTAVNIGHSTSEVTIGDNLTVNGDLTVLGDTTTLDVANLLVEDPFIILAKNQTGPGSLDAGFLVERGDNTNVAFIWDETNGDVFRAITTNSGQDTAGNVASAGHVPIAASEFYLESSANKIDLDTDVVITAAADITLAAGGANVKPNADNTIALGVSGTAFSDLFLGSGAVVNFNAGDTTLTHVNTVGLLINGSKQLQFGDSGTHIKQASDSNLEFEADGSLILDTPTIDFEDDGVVLAFGDNSEVTLTHVHNAGLLLNSEKQIQFGHADENISGDGTDLTFKSANDFVFDFSSTDYPAIRLKSSPSAAIKQPSLVLERIDSTIENLDYLGALRFGGREGAAGDFIEGARIQAKAVDDFSTSGILKYGSSELAFSTRNSAALATRMVLSRFGHLGIGVDDPDTRLEVLSTSTQQKWSYDADSFATMTVAADSHTTLAAGESGNITLDSVDINLTASGDVNIPASVGLTFGADTNKVEVDGSNDMTVITANDMTFQTGGADADKFLFRNGADISEETKLCIGNTSTFIERQGGSNNIRFVSDRPIQIDCGGTLTLDGNSGVNIKHADSATLSITRSTDTVLLANHANDIVFQTNPGSATEIARFDTSEASLVMPTSNKVQFREATTFIHSPGANTLDIETGTSNNGVINIGTDNSSNITIGKAGSGGTTTINNLSLSSVTIDGDTGRMTFAGSGTDPFIERTAGSAMRFTDGSNTNVTLSDLASNAVSATAFTTIEAPTAHRAVINSARRLALIGSGSVGGVHADELYGFNGTTSVSDIMLFCSGTIKPIGKFTPHGDGTEVDKFQRRNVALDANLVSSGSVFMRGLYHTDANGDIANKSGQTSPHPVGAFNASTGYTGYVFTVDQTNAANAAASNLHGTAFLHGNLRMTYSAAAIHCPIGAGADLEIQNFAGSNTLIKFDPDNSGSDPHVMIPSDSSSKLAFGANTRYISNPNGTTDIKIQTTGNVDISGGNLVIGADADGTDRVLTFGHTTNKTVLGIDDDQDVFAINTHHQFAASNDFEIDGSGNVTIGNGNLIVDGGEIRGSTGVNGSLKLYSNGNVVVEIDSNNDATDRKFIVAANNETPKFEVDEAGNVQADGNLDIDGTGTSTFAGTIHAAGLQVDSTTLVVDSGNNHVGIGTSSPSHALHVAGNNSNEAEIVVTQYRNSASDPSNFRAQFSRGTSASPSIVQDDDIIGTLAFHPYDGADFNSVGAEIRCDVDGTPGSNDTPGRIHFRTTSDGSSSPTTRMTILSNGNVGIGTVEPATPFHLVGDFTAQGHILPQSNNSYNLGSPGARFANIYTNDLNLCNEGRGNDVDGTSGNWTIQEGEDNLYVINNITGKKFKMMLTPVEDGE